jgi:type II secretory pathway predicted ATPase ExeA
VLYLGTPGVGLRGIYGLIITTLGATPRFHHAALIPQAQEMLAAETAERGKHVVLIIDEAHLLDAESLEGIRCLSNMGMDQTAPFCLLLLGQPTLRRKLKQGTFTALDQRIAVRYAIAGLDAKETQSYVAHHLALAGRSDTLFSDDAVALIHDTSRGLPRLINNLAVAALIAAFAANKAIVDQSAARIAVAEISAE